jgi:hypothetical protein
VPHVHWNRCVNCWEKEASAALSTYR